MMDDFSAHPQTIGELRAERDANGAHWTPREVLVSMLRDLDAGRIKPDALAVIWAEIDGATTRTHFSQASPNALVLYGMIERAKAIMARD